MIFYVCDCCGKKQDKAMNSIDVPCHMYSLKGKCGYADQDGNSVSGRTDRVDLCNKCYNLAFGALVKAITTD